MDSHEKRACADEGCRFVMAQRLVIGSTAARHWLSNFREPKDLDIFSPEKIHGAETFWHPLLESWILPRTDRIATLNELYTIKVSHAPWALKNGTWNKHMWDVTALRKAGARIIQPLHDLLYQVCEDTHGRKKLDLNKDKSEFFTPHVRRLYEHDSIHWTVCYGNRPAYLDVLKPGSEVAIDMDLVRSLPHEVVARLFREETYTTALERHLIPVDYKFSYRGAYQLAMRQMITSFTKGWSAQFLVEHYDKLRVPDVDYVALHLSRQALLIRLEES